MRTHHLTSIAGLVTALLLALPSTGLAQTQAGAPVPEWHVEHLDYMSRESGRWVTDNAAYRSENEPATEYVLEFGPSFDGSSMTGRLYGQVNGRYTVTLWEYRSYWYAATATSLVSQFGWDGASGIRTIRPEGDGIFRVEQTVVTPGLPSRIEGHLLTVIDEDTHRTNAYGIDASGRQI
jgi:hypothetical protein